MTHQNQYSPWTPERDATLIEYRMTGYTFTEIAECFGMTKSQVAGRVFRLRKAGRL